MSGEHGFTPDDTEDCPFCDSHKTLQVRPREARCLNRDCQCERFTLQEYQRGELVEDSESGMRLVVLEEIGLAGDVELDGFGESIAEINDCEEQEVVYECAGVDGWSELDSMSCDERLELVERLDCKVYSYPVSRLDSNNG